LAGGHGAEHKLNRTRRIDRHFGTLARRAGIQLDRICDADAAIPAAPARLGTALLEPCPIAEFDGALQTRRIVTAVVAGGGAVLEGQSDVPGELVRGVDLRRPPGLVAEIQVQPIVEPAGCLALSRNRNSSSIGTCSITPKRATLWWSMPAAT